ncbi:DUF624 domain-containing protein [Radiobacillus kanasensis]|uniref:DUF624 domain-containing protein n=1 Tax=Radiobacillus kanasensis TaxID=2844358 RepID=UPI001E516195|nr:DUF624 domain-containing protein [Radiobacillus kanasensis]UFT98584.1 DUF624 domain-containing protein [Radiobacillus kanasensis]
MFKSDNGFFKVLEIFSNFLILNLLWIICCIPIITIFPSTTAMYAVVRKWLSSGMEIGTFQQFFSFFKSNFKKSFIIGLIWLFFCAVLYMDSVIVLNYDFTGELILVIFLLLFGLTFLFTTVFIFFILVHFELPLLQTITRALLFALSHLPQTILLIGILVGSIALTYVAPVFILISGSLIAFIQYFIFDRLMKRIHQKNGLI